MKKRVESQPGLGLEVESPGASARHPISVGALTTMIRDLLEEGLGEVWVEGEVSNLRTPASGHVYFTLKDADSTLAAVMFRTEAARRGFTLADGQAVLARGHITVYEVRGQYQLQVSELRARGQGGLQAQFEALKTKLQLEGLFSLERKRALPVFPEAVGLVTSLQGAVLHDMLQVLRRRAPGLRFRVRGVRVQGPGAAQEIAAAIAAFSAEGAVDLVIIARGGGSLEDLWAFNEEPVARALAVCSVPTVSAIGHETDFTIADFVADLRAPTPSAAAEMITRDWGEWREEVAMLQARLTRTARQALAAHRLHLSHLAGSRALREPGRVVRQWAQRLDDLREQLHAAATGLLASRRDELGRLSARLSLHHPTRELVRKRTHLAHLTARLRTLGPQATLDRGYALVLDEKGHPVAEASPALEGKAIRLVLRRGVAGAQVTRVKPAETLLSSLAGTAAPDPVPSSPTRKKRGRAKGS